MIPIVLSLGLISISLSALGAAIDQRSTRRIAGPSLPALIALAVAAVTLSVHASTSAPDRGNYLRRMEPFVTDGWRALRDTSVEPVVAIFMYVSTRFSNPDTLLFALVAFSVLALLYRAATALAGPNQAAVILISYTLTGFFTAYTANAIRQGVAVALVFLAMAMTARHGFNRQPKLLLLAAALSHYASFATALVAAITLRLNPRLGALVRIWILSAVVFLVGFGFPVGQNLSQFSTTLAAYTTQQPEHRLDFFFVHCSVLLIAAAYRVLRISNHSDPLYLQSLKMLIAQSALFLSFGFVSYSDRLASVAVIFAVTVAWLPLFRLRGVEGGYVRLIALGVFLLYGISPLGVAEYLR